MSRGSLIMSNSNSNQLRDELLHQFLRDSSTNPIPNHQSLRKDIFKNLFREASRDTVISGSLNKTLLSEAVQDTTLINAILQAALKDDNLLEALTSALSSVLLED
jgi:hypothetical protein